MVKKITMFMRRLRFRTMRARLRRLYGARLYENAVQASRSARLFRQGCIPDTPDGRLDALTLHLFLYTQRFSSQRELVVRSMMEAFVRDLDRSLREMGTGDLSVGKKVKKILSRVYGAFAAYSDASNRDEWCNALEKNILCCNCSALDKHRKDFATGLSRMSLHEVVGRSRRVAATSVAKSS